MRIKNYLQASLERITDNYVGKEIVSNEDEFGYLDITMNIATKDYNIETLLDLKDFLYDYIDDEEFAKCIALKTFFDLYQFKDDMNLQDKNVDTDDNAVVIPGYVYTL